LIFEVAQGNKNFQNTKGRIESCVIRDRDIERREGSFIGESNAKRREEFVQLESATQEEEESLLQDRVMQA